MYIVEPVKDKRDRAIDALTERDAGGLERQIRGTRDEKEGVDHGQIAPLDVRERLKKQETGITENGFFLFLIERGQIVNVRRVLTRPRPSQAVDNEGATRVMGHVYETGALDDALELVRADDVHDVAERVNLVPRYHGQRKRRAALCGRCVAVVDSSQDGGPVVAGSFVES